MTPIAKEALRKEDEEDLSDKKEYWQNELKSLGIEPKRQNELNDKEELHALADIIKEVYYQDYKNAYSNIGSSSPANSRAAEKGEQQAAYLSAMQHSEIRFSKKHGTARIEPRQKYFYATIASIS